MSLFQKLCLIPFPPVSYGLCFTLGHSSLSCVSPITERGWVLESRPREKTAIGCEKKARRTRNKELLNWESFWKKPRIP